MALNVIGLISGGKDSLYSLAHCIQNGHKVVALANLYPGNTTCSRLQSEGDEGPDLDSFMYQTVGHSIVPLYAEALGIPLYRRAITGTAVQSGRYYESDSNTISCDETEDMLALVQDVLQRHPEINALSAGAILSTYQRTRVESVAVRLGLVPLAYLWQYPALPAPISRDDSLTGLLDDMNASGCDARIIKIASGGVRPNMSFSDVASVHTRKELTSAMLPFFADAGQEFWLRGAVLGEGGEYETLALNGPGSLWKQRIQIDGHETCEAEGGVTYTRLGRATLVERSTEHSGDLPIPVLLDNRFARVQSDVNGTARTVISSRTLTSTLLPMALSCKPIDVRSNFIKSSNMVQVFNLTSPGATAAEQFETLITTLPFVLGTIARSLKLDEACLGLENIVSTMMLLRSMEDFASVNQVYTTKLWPQGLSNPPARVTVAACLPREAKVAISLSYHISTKDTQARKGLHVQSRSYWAPANIGPYSQAISVPIAGGASSEGSGRNPIEVVHLAGQIPLISSSMAMSDANFAGQAVLALQNLWRVAQERGIDWWVGAGVAFLAQDGYSESNVQERVQQAAQIWRRSHETDGKGNRTFWHGSTRLQSTSETDEDEDEDNDIDVWELQQRHRGFASTTSKMTVGDHLHKLPNTNISLENRNEADEMMKAHLTLPPFIAAEVIDLPRNAPIEWWSTGIAGLMTMGGVQTKKMFSIPTNTHASWSLTGIALDNSDSEEMDAAEDEIIEVSDRGTSVLKPRALSFFLSLVIKPGTLADESHRPPRTLEDLVTHLLDDLERTDSFRCELVTIHSFVNLSCLATASIYDESRLLQDSCTVQCSHVWSSQLGGTEEPRVASGLASAVEVQESGLAEGMGNIQLVSEDQNDIGEIAVAVIMRLDAFWGDGLRK